MTKRDELHKKIKEILLNAKPFRHYKSADDILDTIYAELQEPDEDMEYSVDTYDNDTVEIWKTMLAASALAKDKQ